MVALKLCFYWLEIGTGPTLTQVGKNRVWENARLKIGRALGRSLQLLNNCYQMLANSSRSGVLARQAYQAHTDLEFG